MNQVTDAYAVALLDLGVPCEDIQMADEALRCCPELSAALSNPVISIKEKDSVIEKVFPLSLHKFFKVLCRNERAASASEIFSSYHSANRRANNCIKATLEYVTPFTDEQIMRLTDYIKRRTGCESVELELVHKPEIMGGFVLRAGDYRYDRSTAGAVAKMKKKLFRPEADNYIKKKNTEKAPDTLRATLQYVTPPTEKQKERITELLRKKTGYSHIELNLVENKDLIGGFILHAGNLCYDRSAVRKVTDMRRKLMRR